MPVILLGGTVPKPDTVAGITGWWESDFNVYSDAGTTPAVDNDPVRRWVSRLDSHYVDQATLGNRPTFKTGILVGLPIVRFDASNDVLDTDVALSTFLAVGAKTIFTVHFHSSGATGNIIGDTGGKISFFLGNTGGDLNAANDDGAVDTATNTAQSTGVWTIGTYLHSGGNLYSGVTDTRTASMVSVASGNTTSLAGIGRFGAGPAVVNPLGGDLAAVVMYNAALIETDRQIVERYLSAKYSIGLPY